MKAVQVYQQPGQNFEFFNKNEKGADFPYGEDLILWIKKTLLISLWMGSAMLLNILYLGSAMLLKILYLNSSGINEQYQNQLTYCCLFCEFYHLVGFFIEE